MYCNGWATDTRPITATDADTTQPFSNAVKVLYNSTKLAIDAPTVIPKVDKLAIDAPTVIPKVDKLAIDALTASKVDKLAIYHPPRPVAGTKPAPDPASHAPYPPACYF